MPVIDAVRLIAERVGAISHYHAAAGVEKAELDLSGGVDSAVMACLLVRALGSGNVILVHSRFSTNPAATKRAHDLAAALHTPLLDCDFSDLLDQIVNTLGMRCSAYREAGGGQCTVTHDAGGQAGVESCRTAAPPGTPWTAKFNPAEYDLVMWLSDGVLTFVDATGEPVPLITLVPHLTDIRVKTPGFLQRSHRFFLRKTCVERGWVHTDDFSSAAILIP